VKNNVCNLFVLPKKKSDSEEHKSMMDVHNEVKSILQPSAFDDPTIPREETQYLKVVYDAKYT
jgi:hypothetical protein